MQSKQQGFTLLEMMVAFVMVSLLFLALFSAFNTISRGWDAADKRMTKNEDMSLINGFLRRQLEQILVVKMNTESEAYYAFEGERDVVRYAAPLQPLQTQGGIYLIELGVASSDFGKKLEVKFTPYRPELTWDDAFDGLEPVLVYEGFKQVEFSYFGSENIDDDASWQDSWVDKEVYPSLLKLTLKDDEQTWPEMIVSLPQVDEYAQQKR